MSKLSSLPKAIRQAFFEKETHSIDIWRGALRCFVVAMIAVYGAWQLYWLSQLQLPPALFLALTGLPAPTTGGSRSIACLIQGDWIGSLKHNAMAIPLTVLAAASAIWPSAQFCIGQPIRLPKGTGLTWLLVLAIAWAIKLIQALAT